MDAETGGPQPEDDGRLDAEKLDVLRAWGTGLARDEREEVRAAGRAISILIDEVDRLYVELWHARDRNAAPAPAAEPPPAVDGIERPLRERIGILRGLSGLRRAQSDA